MNTPLNFKQIILAGVISAGVATVINVILFFIFHSAGIFTDSIMVKPNQPLTAMAIVIASIMPSLVGACVFFPFEKYGKNGIKTFSIVSIVLLILSLVNPFMGIPNVTVPYAVALDVMHVVVAVSLLFFLRRAKK